jgi:uncharacterized protein (TIGR02453 family)
MNRAWFTEHKHRYEADWVAPMTALLAHVHRRLIVTYRPARVAAPKIMRIYRDVRFAKDKAPYKTHIGAQITLDGRAGPLGTTAIYIHLGVDEEFVGGGIYMFEPDKLARWRKAVAGKPGGALTAVIERLRAQGYDVGGHDDYKHVPKPYAATHRHAGLLKLRGLTASAGAIPPGMLHQAALADWIATQAVAIVPMVRWLARHVG